jgi:hypothetical protein
MKPNEWHVIWAMRWILASVAATVIAGAWGALPEPVRPDLPNWLRWIVAAVGVGLPALAALHLRVQKRLHRLKSDDSDEASA